MDFHKGTGMNFAELAGRPAEYRVCIAVRVQSRNEVWNAVEDTAHRLAGMATYGSIWSPCWNAIFAAFKSSGCVKERVHEFH